MFKHWKQNTARQTPLCVTRIIASAVACASILLLASPAGHEAHAQSAAVPIPSEKPVLTDNGNIPVPSLKPAAQEKVKSKTPKPRAFKASSKGMSKKNKKLYREIFALFEQGQTSAALETMKKLSDKRLYGYALKALYQSGEYVPTFKELKQWMDHYADQPGAKDIYQKALNKKPVSYKGTLKKATTRNPIPRRREPTMINPRQYQSDRVRSQAQIERMSALNKQVTMLIRSDRPTQALTLLQDSEDAKLMDPSEYDMTRARISASYLYNGKISAANAQASQSVNRSGKRVPLAGWIAGLSSWVSKDYAKAAKYFEITAGSPYASGWTKSAAAYWAARAHMRMGNVKQINTWLDHATDYPRTFYGLIATRALGRDFDFNWKTPTFTKNNYKTLSATKAGTRAMALVDVGQGEWAEDELIRMNLKAPNMRDALISYADYAKLPGLSMRLGSAVSPDSDGDYYDAALYPIGPWQPQSGFKIESALLHAIMRQESRFHSEAKSGSGARGLMQIIPSTARSVGLKKTSDLENPEINLELGQRYILALLDERAVRSDLFRLLIAYNGGPGNLKKWSARWPEVKDPLLFVELLPSAETRAYVERVLSNYWIYRLREDAPTPTLDAVSAGKKPSYSSIKTASAN